MEEGRKTPRTIAHSHGSKNLPSNTAWVAHRPSPLQAAPHPTKPEPQHRSHSTSHPQCLCGQHSMESSWQADRAGGFKGAASHFPSTAAQPQPTTSVKKQWAFLASSARPPPGPLLFLPPTRANGKRSPHQGSFLWAGSCKIQDSRRTSWPQTGTWWWDAEGRHHPICNCSLMHRDWGAWK